MIVCALCQAVYFKRNRVQLRHSAGLLHALTLSCAHMVTCTAPWHCSSPFPSTTPPFPIRHSAGPVASACQPCHLLFYAVVIRFPPCVQPACEPSYIVLSHVATCIPADPKLWVCLSLPCIGHRVCTCDHESVQLSTICPCMCS